MPLDVWLIFVPAAFALNMFPGPNNLLAMGNAARHGFSTALLASAGRVVAVESDHRLAGWLRGRHAGAASFELIHGDALEVDLGGIFERLEDGGRRAAVVSNIPYSISGPDRKSVV